MHLCLLDVPGNGIKFHDYTNVTLSGFMDGSCLNMAKHTSDTMK
jgi:hypothetical protein